jgi:lipopolysaccharide export system ATP-binding protein
MAQLQIRGLTKIYNKVKVVDGVDLVFETGRITALLGRNGAGKTTTFLMIAGIVRPDAGDVFLDGESVSGIPSYERSRRGLIYLPQQHSVFLKATVFQNLFMMLEQRHAREIAREKAEALLGEFGLAGVRDSRGYELSGGEKRRLEIARSMIMAPRFLLLDEPFTGIDPITIREIQKIILLLKAKGISIIVTDHNVKDTFSITDTAYIIHKGRILSSGLPADIVREEQTRKLFLGKDFEWGNG